MRPFLERIGFRVSENVSQLIWERSDEHEEDIVTASLFLLAGSHKVQFCNYSLLQGFIPLH